MSEFISFRAGDISWRVRADVAGWLFDDQGLRLSSWLESGRASVVKRGPHRTVYRVELDGHSIYVKHHRVTDPRSVISQWIQTSKGRREWDRAERAAQCDIPTVVPLALGEEQRAGLVFENYLVTEGIDGVEPLDAMVQQTLPRFPPERRERICRRLTDGLAALVARLHEAGVLHPDLHAGNVLVRLHSDDRVELYLIDLHEAVNARVATWRRSRQNLLAFGLFFLTTAGPRDRIRFLRRYLACRPKLRRQWRNEVDQLHRDLIQKSARLWRRLDSRCVTINRRFVYANIDAAHGHAVTEFGTQPLEVLLRDPDSPFRSQNAEVLKSSPSSDVVRVPMQVGGETVPVIYKRFNCPKLLDPVRATFHHSPALRAWHTGHGLLIRRIPTARPIAMIERIVRPFVRETYLVTQYIPNSITLRDYLNSVLLELPEDERRRRARALIASLAGLIRKMHERRISHRDMKAANFLIAPPTPPAPSPEIYLIDLAGVQIWRRLPWYRCVQNLTRILVSLQSYSTLGRTDALRFLRTYLPRGLRDRQAWKALWRQLDARANQKIERNNKLNRKVS